jgi:hypothetical protein
MLLATSSSVTVGISLINSTDQTSQQQYVFDQENTIASSNNNNNNKTSADITFFPQIHNYTSSPPGPVNSWIIETTTGVILIDT